MRRGCSSEGKMDFQVKVWGSGPIIFLGIIDMVLLGLGLRS